MGHKFPCKDCIVKGNCGTQCEILMDDKRIMRHLLILGNCPDCGGERLYLNFNYNPHFKHDNKTVDQFNLLCIECGSFISIWMNLSVVISVVIDLYTYNITLPGASRRFGEKMFYFKNSNYQTIITTFYNAIDLYIMPNITRKYGRVSNAKLNNGIHIDICAEDV
jgi:hypothetical protein